MARKNDNFAQFVPSLRLNAETKGSATAMDLVLTQGPTETNERFAERVAQADHQHIKTYKNCRYHFPDMTKAGGLAYLGLAGYKVTMTKTPYSHFDGNSLRWVRTFHYLVTISS